MDVTSPSRSAWGWVSEWRWTTSFWVAEVVVGVSAGVIVLATTGDTGWALAAVGIGAVLVFVFALFWKWWEIRLRISRDFRQAVIQFAQSPPVSPTAEPSPPSGPSQVELNRQRFTTYVDEQLVKMLDAQSRAAMPVVRNWDSFMSLAKRTASGIRRFDDSLGNYVDDTIDDVEENVAMTEGANRIIDAIREAKTLYDGRDPTVIAPF